MTHVKFESAMTNPFPNLFMKDLKIIMKRLPMDNQLKISSRQRILRVKNVPEKKSYRCKTPCKFCGLIIYKDKLAMHIGAVHDKCRPYKCDTCAYSASQKGDIHSHKLRVHSKYKPYKTPCKFCGLITYKDKLAMHICAVH